MRQYIIYKEAGSFLARIASLPLTFPEREDGAILLATLAADSERDALDTYLSIFCVTQK